MAIAVGAAIVALVIVEIIHRVLLRLARRSVLMAELTSHAHQAFQAFSVVLAVRLAVDVSPERFGHRHGLLHAAGILLIITGAWLVATVLLALEDAALARYRIDVPDNRAARRIRTQIVMLRRVTIAAVVVVALALILMTFPQVRTIGTSLLASAGIICIVAALAAQSVLGNVIAGLQLAFSDAIRIDDMVVVEQEWARVEEIALSHVILQVTDATGGLVRLRALVSAADAPRLWDLRCGAREHLVTWVRDHGTAAVPLRRIRLARTTRPPVAPAEEQGADARVFSGSDDGVARGEAFTGPDRHLHETVLSEQDRLDEP